MTQPRDCARAEAERRHNDAIARHAAALEPLSAVVGVGLGVPVARDVTTLALAETYSEGLTVDQMDDLSRHFARSPPVHDLTDDYLRGAMLNLPDHDLTNDQAELLQRATGTQLLPSDEQHESG